MHDFTEFAKPLDVYIEDLTEREGAFAAAAGETNFPVHDQRLGLPAKFPNHQAAPRSLYFYYVRLNRNGGLYVRHYFYPGGNHADRANPAAPEDWQEIPNTPEALIPILQQLVANARAQGQAFPLVGNDFVGIDWWRKSYVALFVDEANWALHKEPETGQAAVLFITEPKDGQTGTPNHSFFDGQNLDIPMPDGLTRSAFVCLNHMKKDEAGTDLAAGDHEFFQFKIFFRVNFVAGGPPLTVIFDPGGTNLGPPIPPP
jgi:hypothetical protein